MADLKVRFETLTPRGARGHGVRGERAVKQADRSRPRPKRNHGKSSSWPSNAKMRASSLPDLARMADQLQLTPTKPRSPGCVA